MEGSRTLRIIPRAYLLGFALGLPRLKDPSVVTLLIETLPTCAVFRDKIGFALRKHPSAFVKSDYEIRRPLFGKFGAAAERGAAKAQHRSDVKNEVQGFHEMNLRESLQNPK